MTSRRYDSEQHLQDFKKFKKYPKIHDSIFFAVSQRSFGIVGDLCSSTGLLGHRFKTLLGLNVKALEANQTAIKLGTDYNIYGPGLPVAMLQINNNTTTDFANWMEGITTLLARRCLAELSTKINLGTIAKIISDAQVKIVALEGNNQSVNSTHPFGNVDTQAAFFLDAYKVVYFQKNIRVLKYKG